jgi:hypothetical protein
MEPGDGKEDMSAALLAALAERDAYRDALREVQCEFAEFKERLRIMIEYAPRVTVHACTDRGDYQDPG